jgi:lipopolysaccharide export system permease protein
MRILDRYVAREFLKLFALFSIAAPMLFVLGDLTDNIDTFTERGLSPGTVALGYLYQLPQFILWSFPIAALIAVVFTVGNMTRYSELSAAKAGGVSFYRAIITLPLLGVVLTFAGIALSELVPVTLSRKAVILGERNDLGNNRNDFVYRSEDGHVFGIRRLDVAGGRIYGVTMEREGDGESLPGIHVFAREAAWDSTAGWTMTDGYMRIFPAADSGAGIERMFKFAQMKPLGFHERPSDLVDESKDPEEMRYGELKHFIEVLERSGGKPFKLRFDLAQKLAIPVATLIIILFGAPLATTGGRSGPAYGIGISLGITILYLMLFRLAAAVGSTGIVAPELAVWFPNMLFVVAAAALTVRVRT